LNLPGNGHAANRNPRQDDSKLRKTLWDFCSKNHSSAETFAAELPPEKLANHAFSDEFSEAEKTHQFLSVQLPAASQT